VIKLIPRSLLGSMRDLIRTTISFPDSETLEIGELLRSRFPLEADNQVLLVVILTWT
jgi:hypothetical protein